MIIGVSGKKHNGKDVIGDYLVSNYGYKKIAYADPLKQAVKVLFDLSDEQVYGSQKEQIDERWCVSPRQVMQFIGTGLVRNHMHELLPDIKDDFWVELLKAKIQNGKYVICDIRFANEANFVKSRGGIIIRVKRPGFEGEDVHESEKQDFEVDYEVINDRLENLYKQIDDILGK